MNTLTNENGSWKLIELSYTKFEYYKKAKKLNMGFRVEKGETVLGTLSDIDESEAELIVGEPILFKRMGGKYMKPMIYRNYNTKSDEELATAKASLKSYMEANNLNPETTIIIKQNQKV